MEWEYYTLQVKVGRFWGPKIDAAGVDATLNELGSQGWEMVTAFPVTQTYGSTSHLIMIFKRQR